MTQQIGNVRAGQWRKINISIQHADQGNVKFIVTVQTWVYDSPLVVDVMSKDYAVYEEEIPDVDDEVTMPGSPVLLLDCTDHRITDPFRITAASFDFDYTPVRSNHPAENHRHAAGRHDHCRCSLRLRLGQSRLPRRTRKRGIRRRRGAAAAGQRRRRTPGGQYRRAATPGA